MHPPLRRAGRLLLVVLALAVPEPLSAPVRASAGLEVLVHLRGPDGREETRRVSHFKFVFYDRRYIRRSGGIGGSPTLKVRDLPREVSWIQNDALRKIKLVKIRRLTLEYRDAEGSRSLHLVVFRRRGKEVIWPAALLRNAAVARLPHFRGQADGKTVDLPLPPLVESVPVSEPAVTSVDFDFPGKPVRRRRF